jgi:hypothetical protein
MRVQIKDLKNKKRTTLLYTPSALEKWNYEYRVETEKKEIKKNF